MNHDTRVREVNPREITFPYKRHGRIVGQDHRHSCDGYQAYCSCGWVSETSARSCEAHADAQNHSDDMWGKDIKE